MPSRFLTLPFLVLTHGIILAQVYRTTIASGYTATFLLNSPATRLIFTPVPSDSGALYVTGSRFIGAQSGLSIRYTQALDERERFFFPIGVDITFFRGKQRQENLIYLGRGQVAADMYSLIVGLQYRYADLPLAQAFLYAGIEPQLSLIVGPRFSYTVTDVRTNTIVDDYSIDTSLKSNAVRGGGALRLGAQGIIEDKLIVHFSVAWGVFNVIGRDSRTTDPQRRGLLLTPTRIFETSERIEQFIKVALWLQYPF